MNSRKEHLDGLAVGILLACCMFWGLQQVLVKSIMHEVAPLFQASLRCMGACVLLLIWCRVRGIRLFERDGSWWPGLLAGALFAAEFACIYLGLRYTSASRLTVFLYTSPFWVAALVPLFVKSERLRPMQWLGMACAFVAVAFAMRDASHAQLEREAQRLAALLETARAQARASELTVVWRTQPAGFVFEGLPLPGLPRQWLATTTFANATPVLLGPEPLIPPQSIALSSSTRPDRRLWVVTDGLRPFTVQNKPNMEPR